jgi:hypothetical protein
MMSVFRLYSIDGIFNISEAIDNMKIVREDQSPHRELATLFTANT